VPSILQVSRTARVAPTGEIFKDMYWLQGLSGPGELSRVFAQKLPRTVPNWSENAHDIAEGRRKPLGFWEEMPARNESTTAAHAGCAGAVTGCSDGGGMARAVWGDSRAFLDTEKCLFPAFRAEFVALVKVRPPAPGRSGRTRRRRGRSCHAGRLGVGEQTPAQTRRREAL